MSKARHEQFDEGARNFQLPSVELGDYLPPFLRDVVVRKRKHVADMYASGRAAVYREGIAYVPPPADLVAAITDRNKPVRLIAEYMRRSPVVDGVGIDAAIKDIAGLYREKGVAVMSMVTDEHFGGQLEDLRTAAAADASLPLMQMDFVIDPAQIYEARIHGASGILLLATIFERENLQRLIGLTEDLGMTPIVEVKDQDEIVMAESAGARVIGINNRDLFTMKGDVTKTLSLLPHVSSDRIVVSESCISNRRDIEMLISDGGGRVDAMMVGSALMQSRTMSDLSHKLDELLLK